ncbi:tetratricopeptide repeat protein [Halomonas campisalis]|uniref:Tetratricopeptide repeat protein n=1 Tax=Billgrantia campisalis TaxID=74661 RepID=A0ABS9P6C7_9GAMM|nr:tetratricopeptide repeat protein [Halomonas campisalis]MCG6657309.1 tetratricopeptide repeat protein [Halomonas campisalis]MDR5864149.1 tetratricopeptide repeat protein [Halomonas campisalis]
MIAKPHLRIACAALVLTLGGCATGAQQQGVNSDLYGPLGDDRSSVAYGTAFPVASPEEAYRNGEAALRARDPDRALFEYLRGLRMESRPQAEPLYRIGIIHHGRGNHDLARKAYRWALEVDSQHVGAGTALGIVLLQQRDFEGAERHLTPIASRRNAPWQAHNALGVIADMRGEHGQAESHYRQALDASPNTPLVLNNLGYSRYLAGDWPGARQSLRRAVSANPHYELAWRNLGLVYAREGDHETAIEAVSRNGDRAKAYNDIGYISMLEGRFQDAMGFFEEAMRLSPAYYVTASENARNLDSLMRRNGAGARPN